MLVNVLRRQNLKIHFHLKAIILPVLGALLLPFAACNRDTSGGDVMASVNGRKIYKSEVDKYYAIRPPVPSSNRKGNRLSASGSASLIR